MADESENSGRPPMPMDNYTAMLILSFVAISIGCLILAIELYRDGLPLTPP